MRGDQLRLIAVATLALCATVVVAQLDVNIRPANEAHHSQNSTESTTTTTTTATSSSTAAAAKPAHPKSPAGKANAKLNDIVHSEIGKHGAADNENDYAYAEYSDDYYSDLYDDAPAAKKSNKADNKKQVIVQKHPSSTWNLQPIKGNDLNTLEDEKHHHKTTTTTAKPSKPQKQDAQLLDDTVDGDHDDDDGEDSDDTNDDIIYDDDDEDDDDDDVYADDIDDHIGDKVATSTSTTTARTMRTHKPTHASATATAQPHTPSTSRSHTGCPMNCLCQNNYNGYMVASCDRLDAETMHFDASITDLELISVPPMYPLLFGADFFVRIGLKHVSSIRIVDSTIENIHPDAFRGLDEVYSINLTNTGLDMLPPDAFAGNRKLRILTLSDNDLHAMQAKHSPFVDYLLNAPSIEELYLTRCNIKQLLPTAFSRLPNVVFISLAENMLVTLPHNIFHRLTALEEVDLSSNSIENLPRHIFDNTSLSILTMRYNEMAGRPAFVAHSLQKLDLSYNKLENVNDMFFTDMPNLNNLVLKGNAIRKVHHAAFAPLKDLRHIDLSFNDLEQVSAMLFLENGYLDTIRMNDNARLNKLPLDGFASTLKDFNVYLFDASNCDLNELGENTFATMPRLTILNLSWNNIESLGTGLFSFLARLVKLDLSNNLISELSDLQLLHNRMLRKLNLAGNPLEKLSSRVFLPTKQLTELDVSDCNLKTIWTESAENAGQQPKNLLKNLKTLNVSNNEIVHVRQTDLQLLERLSVFDVSNNKLACDRDFRDLMKWLEKKKIGAGELRPVMHDSASKDELAAMLEKRSPWEEYSLMRCKELVSAALPKLPAVSKPQLTFAINDDGQEDDDASDDNDSDGDDDDDDEEEDDEDDGIVDSINDKANEKLPKTDDDGIGNEYDDDDGPDADDDDDIATTLEKELKLTPGVVDHGIKVTEVKKTKLVDSGDNDGDYSEEEDEDEDDDEEVNAGKGKTVAAADDDDSDADDDDDDDESDSFDSLRITYMQYGYLLPMLLVMCSVLIMLLLVAKIVSLMMRRRGERYRQALLASKNSIVYQKLSEDIGAPSAPKYHRYAPIEQV